MESVGRQLAVVMRPAVGDSNGELLHSFLRVRIHISYCSDSTVIPGQSEKPVAILAIIV